MKTAPTSLKIGKIIIGIKANNLIPRPEFQRRLVWTAEDKIKFIDTILKAYPFPELYVANGPINVTTAETTQLLVDGQQRVTTLVAYFSGDSVFNGSSVRSYAELTDEEKTDFLNYDVAVRDLGSVSQDEIIEVFKRINSTKYGLNDIEINNAVYSGRLMQQAQRIAMNDFFERNSVFRIGDVKRMGDVKFVINIIITFMAGYGNRDDAFEDFLASRNEVYAEERLVDDIIGKVFDYIEEAGFFKKSRIWKKSDFFTAFIEIGSLIRENSIPSPSETLELLESFYKNVDDEGVVSDKPYIALYAKSAVQASNDKINRIRRGLIVNAILKKENPDEKLRQYGFVD